MRQTALVPGGSQRILPTAVSASWWSQEASPRNPQSHPLLLLLPPRLLPKPLPATRIDAGFASIFVWDGSLARLPRVSVCERRERTAAPERCLSG